MLLESFPLAAANKFVKVYRKMAGAKYRAILEEKTEKHQRLLWRFRFQQNNDHYRQIQEKCWIRMAQLSTRANHNQESVGTLEI